MSRKKVKDLTPSERRRLYLKEAFRLRDEENFSLLEISRKLGIPRSTVCNWFSTFADGDPSGHRHKPRAIEPRPQSEVDAALDKAKEAVRDAMKIITDKEQDPPQSSREALLSDQVEFLSAKVRELEKQLADENMARRLYETLVDLVKENGGEPLLKKSGPKQ